jgi:hypothetical protein
MLQASPKFFYLFFYLTKKKLLDLQSIRICLFVFCLTNNLKHKIYIYKKKKKKKKENRLTLNDTCENYILRLNVVSQNNDIILHSIPGNITSR